MKIILLLFSTLCVFGCSPSQEKWPPELRKINEDDPIIKTKDIISAIHEINSQIVFKEYNGSIQTLNEEYDIQVYEFVSNHGDVQLTITLSNRLDSDILESCEIHIDFPIGKFPDNQETIKKLTKTYIVNLLNLIISESDTVKKIADPAYTHQESVYDIPYIFSGNLGLKAYRIDYDYIDPIERVGLEFSRIDHFYEGP